MYYMYVQCINKIIYFSTVLIWYYIYNFIFCIYILCIFSIVLTQC